MKFVSYTNRAIFLILLPLMGIWGFAFYYAIAETVMEETDESLEHTRAMLVSRMLAHPEMTDLPNELWANYQVHPLTNEEAQEYEGCFYDTEIYIETEDDYEPVRMMKSCFRGADNRFYELIIWQSTLERDDMVETVISLLFLLFFLLVVFITFTTRQVLKRAFRPVHRLLGWTRKVVPGTPAPPIHRDMRVREFRALGDALQAMNLRCEAAYQQQKQFIENASHELQTPLAVIRGKLELLAETDSPTEHQLQYIDESLHHLGRAVQLNKSLLLLSRIDNRQFADNVHLCMNRIIQASSQVFNDIYEEKHIRFSLDEQAECNVCMNETLAHILIDNLLKNAFVHTPAGGNIEVTVTSTYIIIRNDGNRPLDAERIFERFYHDTSHQASTGLGLSIASSIIRLYDAEISYTFENGHCFKLNFVKASR